MNKFALLFVAIVFSTPMFADQPPVNMTKYFIGEAITTKGSDVSRRPYINARTVDQTAAKISELVISSHENGFAENTSVMSIENNHFKMTESTGTVTGEGDLIGPAWGWISLVGEFKTSGPGYKMRIIDYNLFAGESTIMGHKDFYLTVGAADETLFMQEDVILHEVDKATFEAKRIELLKH